MPVVAGVGGIAFGVFTVLAFVVNRGPGGSYNSSALNSYVGSPSVPAVITSAYLHLLAIVGLIWLAAYLREAISETSADWRPAGIYWGTALVGAASLLLGRAGNLAVVSAGAGVHGGISGPVAYLALQFGYAMGLLFGAVMLAFSLITLAIFWPRMFPSWLRWVTLVLGIIALASPIFIPFFALVIWGLVIGTWLLVTVRQTTQAVPR